MQKAPFKATFFNIIPPRQDHRSGTLGEADACKRKYNNPISPFLLIMILNNDVYKTCCRRGIATFFWISRIRSFAKVRLVTPAELTFFTEMVNLPVAAICWGWLLMVQVLFRVSPALRPGKSKDANCPASQKLFPSALTGASKTKVMMSGVSLCLPSSLSPVRTPPFPWASNGRGL